MGQTDPLAGVGLVSGSSYFISPICAAWPLSVSTHFPGQYILFIENFALVAWSLCKEEKSVQFPGMSNSMAKSQYAYRASLLSWNKPTQQAGQKFYLIRNCKIHTEVIYEANKLFYWGKLVPGGVTCLI